MDFKHYENFNTRTNCLYAFCTIWKTAVYTVLDQLNRYFTYEPY